MACSDSGFLVISPQFTLNFDNVWQASGGRAEERQPCLVWRCGEMWADRFPVLPQSGLPPQPAQPAAAQSTAGHAGVNTRAPPPGETDSVQCAVQCAVWDVSRLDIKNQVLQCEVCSLVLGIECRIIFSIQTIFTHNVQQAHCDVFSVQCATF